MGSSNSTFTNGGGLKGFYASESLPKGWYKIEYHHEWKYWFGLKTASRMIESKEFGVGDVYFVAGQSNASGYNAPEDVVNTFSSDNTNNQQTDNSITRTFNFLNNTENTAISKGLPQDGFVQLIKSGIPIYPNGIASWCWAPLGNEIANKTNTPTLFINLAKPNSSLLYDWVGFDRNNQAFRFDKNSSTTLIGKFYQTLGFYGNILGAKSVLWHQGERDSQILAGIESPDRLPSDITNKYNSYLGELIDNSRNNQTGLADLPWFVSKVSYTSRGNNNSNSCVDDATDGYKDKIFSSTLHGYQIKNGDSKVFQGVTSDFIDGDDWEGNATDFGSSTTECIRAPMQRIHFSGDWLGKLGHAWYKAITNNYSNATGKSSTQLLKSTSVGGSSGNFSFTVQTPPSGAVIFYWCKNDASINNSPSTTNNTSPSISLNIGERLICYAKDAFGRFYASQPFIRNDCSKCRPGGGDVFTISPTSQNFNTNGDTKSITITGAIYDWDLQDVPSWISDVTWNDATQQLLLTAGANNSSNNLNGVIKFVDSETGNLLTTLTISQPASNGNSPTYLTDLSYNYFTGDGYVPNKDHSIVGNNMHMGGIHPSIGQMYNKGVGTHSFMSITYNLNGQYNNRGHRR